MAQFLLQGIWLISKYLAPKFRKLSSYELQNSNIIDHNPKLVMFKR